MARPVLSLGSATRSVRVGQGQGETTMPLTQLLSRWLPDAQRDSEELMSEAELSTPAVERRRNIPLRRLHDMLRTQAVADEREEQQEDMVDLLVT